ncbi:MAG: hypothetical protein KUL86_06340 [Castellaniella sp.]|uniref:hypothetical protein n=1 Tax=unclassified Castellaniella TaxID=2617606 RepID=UPI003315BE33|nr:hypothetical protein [Castellaniella sp.]
MNPCDISTVTIPILIASLSALAAIAAACMAYKSAEEAKKANKISLHNQKLAIYEAFRALSMHMTSRGQSADFVEVNKFNRCQDIAPFIFENTISTDLKKYFRAAFAIADEYRTDQNLATTPETVKKNLEIINSLTESLNTRLRAELKIE